MTREVTVTMRVSEDLAASLEEMNEEMVSRCVTQACAELVQRKVESEEVERKQEELREKFRK